ncbi:hypothetical protein ACFW95_27900 [Streptomyces sp. NPDC059474]|uniref:hypothetical protein n=1 Tax=unclassified Streptomyces TaxID=2593676 RepID=UPI0033D7A73C
MCGRFGSAALLSLLRDPAHHVTQSGHLLPSQSFRFRALNRVDTELETHIPTATGATRTVIRATPVHHRITIVRHNRRPARTSASGPDIKTKVNPMSETDPVTMPDMDEVGQITGGDGQPGGHEKDHDQG